MSENRTSVVEDGIASSAARKAECPWWVCGIVVLGAVLLGTGAVIALANPTMLVSPHEQINDAVRIYAGYFAARNLGLAMVLIAALALRARKMLGSLMLLTAFIQVVDAAIDCFEGRWAVVPAVIVLGILLRRRCSALRTRLLANPGVAARRLALYSGPLASHNLYSKIKKDSPEPPRLSSKPSRLEG